MRKTIIEAQRKRLEDFQYEKIKDTFQKFLRDFMAKYPPLNNDDSKKNYDKLYDLTEKNLEESGKTMQFSKFALRTMASRQAESVDVTALINSGCSAHEFIEAFFLTFFGTLPSETDFEYWENDEKTRGREAFLHTMLEYARTADTRIMNGARMLYSPY